MDAKRKMIAAAAALTVAAMASGSGAQLRIALHDRNDPAPRQVHVGAQVAGLCLGFLLSWSSSEAHPFSHS